VSVYVFRCAYVHALTSVYMSINIDIYVYRINEQWNVKLHVNVFSTTIVCMNEYLNMTSEHAKRR